MRLADRIFATCSAAAFAAVCIVALGVSEAHAARNSGPETRAASGRPVASRPAAAPPRVALPAPRPRASIAQSGKQRSQVATTRKAGNTKAAKARVAQSRVAASSIAVSQWGGISCVPFARAATGMSVKGNAHAWWSSAAGTYERGQRPEAGSVLNFRSTQRMRLGHVAVVARVVDSRTIEIDHANWAGPGGSGKGRVARGVPVIDVSPANDWSAVQVSLPGGGFGSVYPTFGFIYDRPDRGVMIANNLARPTAGQGARRYSEVAEAWSTRVMPAGSTTISIDAPQRSLR
jgi:surface antigen